MPTVLITGASRGIGLELARQYRADDWQVIATARPATAADDLRSTGARVESLDAADPGSIEALASRLGGEPIDVLIANAGVYPHGVDATGWAAAFATNCIGPTLLAQALLPNLRTSSLRRMVAITSRMGSIGDNSAGGSIAYRSSKAALNAAWRSLAIDIRPEGVIAAVLHPGWVQTDMGGRGAQIDARTSVSGLRQVIADLTPEQSGAFFNYDGQRLPW